MFEQTFKNIDDILHKDAGCGSELDYVEQTSWVLFLKYLDDLEKESNRVFDEQNIVSGVPVQNFQLVRTQPYGSATTVFIYCIHKANLRIDASGMTSIQS